MLFIFNAFKIFWKLQIESPGFLSRPTIDVNDLFCFSVIRRMRERIQDTDFHFERPQRLLYRPSRRVELSFPHLPSNRNPSSFLLQGLIVGAPPLILRSVTV
jgi:hypothetical protein